MKRASELAKRTAQQAALRLRATRTALLSTGAMGCITASFWTAFGLPAGLGAAGVALLVLEFLTGEDPKP